MCFASLPWFGRHVGIRHWPGFLPQYELTASISSLDANATIHNHAAQEGPVSHTGVVTLIRGPYLIREAVRFWKLKLVVLILGSPVVPNSKPAMPEGSIILRQSTLQSAVDGF